MPRFRLTALCAGFAGLLLAEGLYAPAHSQTLPEFRESCVARVASSARAAGVLRNRSIARAKRRTIRQWERRVEDLRGLQYSDFSRAIDVDWECSRTKCFVVATPCF